MRTALALALGSLVVTGCGRGSGGAAMTGPTSVRSAEGNGGTVAAGLRDGILFDHNASFNGGRTFRWVPPIPIFVVTPDAVVTDVALEQFLAWETVLGGVGGSPFYTPLGIDARRLPHRGIFFTVGDLPDPTLATGDPSVEFAERRQPASALARRLPMLAGPAGPRALRVPEVTAAGEIQRCLITLDPVLDAASEATVKAVIRHEVGHCLGFIGHVSSGLMKPTCCALNFTADVVGTMKRLYGLPPGTEVTP
jgi:hypothetical protein